MRLLSSQLSTLLLCLVGFASCEKDNYELLDRASSSVSVAPIGFEASVEEADTSYTFSRKMLMSLNVSRNVFPFGTISEGENGTVIALGLAAYPPSQFDFEVFPFSLKFYADVFDPTVVPDELELAEYFTIGREFAFGKDQGEVQFGLQLPYSAGDNGRSRSDYVVQPNGAIIVESIKPFVADLPADEGGAITYEMITFRFVGIIGIHEKWEEYEAMRLRIPYVASKTATVAGTVTLMLKVKAG